jgi:hypothetical protein
MVEIEPALREEYREAWESWQKQLATLHDVFLEGSDLDPPRLKGLLNREARAKERYDAARLGLLGLGASGSPAGLGDSLIEAPRPPGPRR